MLAKVENDGASLVESAEKDFGEIVVDSAASKRRGLKISAFGSDMVDDLSWTKLLEKDGDGRVGAKLKIRIWEVRYGEGCLDCIRNHWVVLTLFRAF